tara:strand:- start:86 stop:322 length:237 start_codon:yes stop_codon:yes gene_type:complete
MKNILTYLILIITIGFVDSIDNNIARVELIQSETTSMISVNINNIPCKIKEGDTLIAINTQGAHIYRCISQLKGNNKK